MKDLSWITYFMMVLACYRFTHLIVFDKITEFLRNPFMKTETMVDEDGNSSTKKVPASMFGYLLNCYWCAGVWSSILIGGGYLLFPRVAMPIIFIFSLAGAQSILETLVGVGINSKEYLAKKSDV